MIDKEKNTLIRNQLLRQGDAAEWCKRFINRTHDAELLELGNGVRGTDWRLGEEYAHFGVWTGFESLVTFMHEEKFL